jgi:hypothetical protein
MKLASIHDLDFEAFSRDAAKQFRSWFGTKQAAHVAKATRPAPEVFQIEDDSFSEAINFRFKVRGVTYRALVTYDALRERYAIDGMRETEHALFIRHAREIGGSALEKLPRSRMDYVLLEDGDL